MKLKNLFLILPFSLLFFISCSELNKDIPTTSPNLSVHKEGFVDPASPDFHGYVFAGTDSLSFLDCAQCHASNFSGGTAKAACTDCHISITVHKDGIINPQSPNFHGTFISSVIGWKIQECGTCHSSDFSGGIASPTCLSCHTYEGGPEACNTCHGDFADTSKIAPPKSLSGAILSSERGVGAHTKHLSENVLGKAVECTQCHTVPNSFSDPIHIDQTPGAELVFGDFAKLSTNVIGGFNYQSSLGDFNPDPSFDFTAGTCANTYCHGYFKNGNLDNVVLFTAQSDGSACGTCHGDPATGNPLPKTPSQGGVHPPNQNCASVFCHGDVVAIDYTTTQIYTIIDKNKHINGKLNWSGTELTY